MGSRGKREVRNAFKSKLRQTGKEIREKETGNGLIGVDDDESGSGDEE